MAVVRQSFDANNYATNSNSRTFAFTPPAAGELIVFCVSLDGADGQSFTVRANDAGGADYSVGLEYLPTGAHETDTAVYYRVSDGADIAVYINGALTWQGGVSVTVYSGLDSIEGNVFDSAAIDTTYSSTQTPSAPTGVATPTSNGVAVYLNAVNESRRWDTADGVTMSPGTLIYDSVSSNARSGFNQGEQVYTDLVAKSTTFNTTSAGSFTLGVTALFKEPGGAPIGAVLSDPTVTQISATGAFVGCSSNSGDGTRYWYVSTSATPPSAADLKAGTGAVSSGSFPSVVTGPRNVQVVGLSPSTTYYHYWIQET